MSAAPSTAGAPDEAQPHRKLMAVMSPFRPANSQLPAPPSASEGPSAVPPLQRAIAAYRATHQTLVGRASVSLSSARGGGAAGFGALSSSTSSSSSSSGERDDARPLRITSTTGSRSRSGSPLISPNNVDVIRSITRRNDAVSWQHGVPTRPRSTSPVKGAPRGASPRQSPSPTRSPPAGGAVGIGGMVSPTLVNNAASAQHPSAAPRTPISRAGTPSPATPLSAALPPHRRGGATASASVSLAADDHRDDGLQQRLLVEEHRRQLAARDDELAVLRAANRRLEDKLRAADEALRATTAELEDAKHRLFVAGAETERSAATVTSLCEAFEEVKTLAARTADESREAQQRLEEERDAAVGELLAAHREIDRLRRAVRELSRAAPAAAEMRDII